MLDVFERVQKCWIVFLTCWMKFTIFKWIAQTFNMLNNILFAFRIFKCDVSKFSGFECQ